MVHYAGGGSADGRTGASAETEERVALKITRLATVDHSLLVQPMDPVPEEGCVDGWRLSVAEEHGSGSTGRRAATGYTSPTWRCTPAVVCQWQLKTAHFRGGRPSGSDGLPGTGAKAYALLGFALVHLPTAYPVRAVEVIRELPQVASARLTERGPKRVPS